MPYVSDKQRRYMHAAAERGEVSKKVVEEFDRASKGKKLPESAPSEKRHEAHRKKHRPSGTSGHDG